MAAGAADHPATAGEAIVINCSGFLDGSMIPPQISVGGRAAEILSVGTAPQDTELNQVTVRVPSGLAPGSAVPVRMNYLGRPSNEVIVRFHKLRAWFTSTSRSAVYRSRRPWWPIR